MTLTPLETGLLVTLFASMLAAIARLYARIGEHDKQLAEMSTKVSPLWATVQKVISDELHHPHAQYAEMDTLLERLDNLTITTEERDRLKILLMQRSVDMDSDITESQRKSAKMMIDVMDKVVQEASIAVPMNNERVDISETKKK